MQAAGNHIISKFSWDTSFDQKEKASELQERLSSWSRMRMQKEITGIFDKLCPAGQTWRIDQLELDLGSIGFSDMEFELGLRLRQQLNELLIDMIMHADKAGRSNIELLNEDASQVNVLRSFLLNGVMPWNYRPETGSLNQMMMHQLQSNRREVIAMLRDIGSGNELVRRRIAWQINEAGMVRIIEGLEPNNHTPVIDFSSEMLKIQMKETIVQASAVDFKKYLWLWILNYLLTERGTIFNKVAFMRSSIRQMAGHYNIVYDELMELILRAVDVVSKMSGIKHDFINTLKVLSKEDKRGELQAEMKREDPAAFRERFILLFSDRTQRTSAEGKAEFRELVTGLYNHGQPAFRELLLSSGGSSRLWTDAVADLDDHSLETVISALSPEKSRSIIEQVYFLFHLGRKISPPLKRKKLWKLAIAFAQQQDAPGANLFLDYCISRIGTESDGISRLKLLQQLLTVKAGTKTKSITTLGLYTELQAAFEAAGREVPDLLQHSLQEQIAALCTQLTAGVAGREAAGTLKRLVMQSLRLAPQETLQALMALPGRQQDILLPLMADVQTAALIAKHARQEVMSVMTVIRDVLAGIKAAEHTGRIAVLTEEAISFVAARQVIVQPHATAFSFLDQVLRMLYQQPETAGMPVLRIITELILQDEQLNMAGISPAAVRRLSLKYSAGKKAAIGKRLRLLATAVNRKKDRIAADLRASFSAKDLAEAQALPASEKDLLLELMVDSGKQLMKQQLKFYSEQVQSVHAHLSVKEISAVLEELYWKCILNYGEHKGKKQMLLDSFRTAVIHRFSLQLQHKTKHLQCTPAELEKVYRLKNGTTLKYSRLLSFIAAAASGNETILYKSIAVKAAAFIAFVKERSGTTVEPVQYFENGKPVQQRKNAKRKLLAGQEQTLVYKGKEIKLEELIAVAMQEEQRISEQRTGTESSRGYRLKNGMFIPAVVFSALLENCIVSGKSAILYDGLKISRRELLHIAIENDPALLRRVLVTADHTAAAKKISRLKAVFSFHVFSARISRDQPAATAELMESMQQLHDLFTDIAPPHILEQLQNACWKLALKLITSGSATIAADLKTITKKIVSLLAEDIKIDAELVMTELRSGQLRLSHTLQLLLQELLPELSGPVVAELSGDTPELLLKVKKNNLLPELCSSIISRKELPAWLDAEDTMPGVLLNALLAYDPLVFIDTVRQERIEAPDYAWLHRTLDFRELIRAAAGLHREQRSALLQFEELYAVLGKAGIRGVSGKEMQQLLFRKLLKAWSSGNWRIISSVQIWNELIWEVCVKKGVSKKEFLKELGNIKIHLPLSMQVALEQLNDRDRQGTAQPKKGAAAKPAALSAKKETARGVARGGIPVKNAGLVLASNYISMLFERLEITKERAFISGTAQTEAPHYLQYLVTGLSATEESLLPLNKVLCGLDLHEPLREGITIAEDKKKLINGLLNAMIGYWPAIGNCSADGFRGNWLVRDGLLTEHEEKWELTVEKRAYDVLIHQSPFSFSIIRLPWMNKPLHVTWPY